MVFQTENTTESNEVTATAEKIEKKSGKSRVDIKWASALLRHEFARFQTVLLAVGMIQ